MTTIAPQVDYYQTPVRAAAPQAIAIARALARRFTRTSIRGAGAVRIGEPAIGAHKFGGYANPPQLFLGYDPKKVAGGAFRGAHPALPSTSTPVTALNTPTMRAMATVTDAQLSRGH